MQGYIININKVKEEDLIITILSPLEVVTAYRFYGARHSNLNIGYKIDFELEYSMKSTIPRLKDVLQLGFVWTLDNEKMYHFQKYIKLFYSHLKDVESLDDFYINLLDRLVQTMNKQNHKRAIIESYVKLCEYEGRLHINYECLLCDMHIDNNISLIRGFMPTHAKCSYSKAFDKTKIDELFQNKSIISFEDNEVEYLWYVILQGL
jgi:hypothetical protein